MITELTANGLPLQSHIAAPDCRPPVRKSFAFMGFQLRKVAAASGTCAGSAQRLPSWAIGFDGPTGTDPEDKVT